MGLSLGIPKRTANLWTGALAQLARVPHWQCGSQGFESPKLHQWKTPESIRIRAFLYIRSTRKSTRLQNFGENTFHNVRCIFNVTLFCWEKTVQHFNISPFTCGGEAGWLWAAPGKKMSIFVIAISQRSILDDILYIWTNNHIQLLSIIDFV